MASKQFFNGSPTTSSAQITSTQTSITGANTATWPPGGDYVVRIDGTAPGTSTAIFEDVLVTVNVQGTGVFTVTRGYDSTSAQAFAAGATLTPVFTAKMINDAFPRIDQSSTQAFTGPISVPSSGGVALPTTSYGSFPVKIDDILVGTDSRYPAATAQITFLNTSNSGTNLLPTGFRHLEIQWMARGDTASTTTTLGLRFNNDGAANYDNEFIGGSAAAISASESLGAASLLVGDCTAATATAGFAGGGRIFIPLYGGTVFNKVAMGDYFLGFDNATTDQFSRQRKGKWRTTATAITRIDLIPGAGNFIAGSLFSLWGLP
jgi:hypothetical protein